MDESWKDYHENAFYEEQPSQHRYQNAPVFVPEIVILHNQDGMVKIARKLNNIGYPPRQRPTRIPAVRRRG